MAHEHAAARRVAGLGGSIDSNPACWWATAGTPCRKPDGFDLHKPPSRTGLERAVTRESPQPFRRAESGVRPP